MSKSKKRPIIRSDSEDSDGSENLDQVAIIWVAGHSLWGSCTCMLVFLSTTNTKTKSLHS